MESKEIAISRRVPVGNRISHTGERVRDWLKNLEVPFDDTVDKLHLKKWEARRGRYVYHYGIVRGKPSFDLEEKETIPPAQGVFDPAFAYLESRQDALR